MDTFGMIKLTNAYNVLVAHLTVLQMLIVFHVPAIQVSIGTPIFLLVSDNRLHRHHQLLLMIPIMLLKKKVNKTKINKKVSRIQTTMKMKVRRMMKIIVKMKVRRTMKTTVKIKVKRMMQTIMKMKARKIMKTTMKMKARKMMKTRRTTKKTKTMTRKETTIETTATKAKMIKKTRKIAIIDFD
jgi:hypothetical protein